MNQTVEGYALVAVNGEYMSMEQISSTDVEIMTFDDPERATLFTFDRVREIKNEIINKTGDFNYFIWKEQLPTDIVKITKQIKVEWVNE